MLENARGKSSLAKFPGAPCCTFLAPAFANEQQSGIRNGLSAGSMSHPNQNPAGQLSTVPPAALDPVRARALALDAGFTEAGLVSLPYPETERDANRFSGWIGAGRAATMRYLERVAEDGRLIRARVETPFPWARSAIVCFSSYASPSEPLSITTAEQGASLTGRADSPDRSSKDPTLSDAWVARYAWSSRVDASGQRIPSDYHKILLKRLKVLESRLHDEFGAFESRAYVDTGPVVERSLAVAAGLGWTGKNTCLIHPKLGSFGFLAVLLTSLEISKSASQSAAADGSAVRTQSAGGSRGLQAPTNRQVGDLSTVGLCGFPLIEQNALDEWGTVSSLAGGQHLWGTDSQHENIGASAPEAVATLPYPDRCGSCTRCIEACPTNALDHPYQMDANRCIAYLTIEHKGPIDASLMPGIGRQVFGCDICQDVCPWNSKSRRSGPIVADPDLEARPELINPSLDWLASLDEPAFERVFNGSPVRRTGFNGLRRNIAIAMGNSGLARFIPQIAEWADAADDGLRSAARWALRRLRSNAM
jgi:epoxyqueuosine reductase QueG